MVKNRACLPTLRTIGKAVANGRIVHRSWPVIFGWAAAVVFSTTGCKEKEAEQKLVRVVKDQSVRLSRGTTLVQLPQKISAVARSRSGQLALGAQDGTIAILSAVGDIHHAHDADGDRKDTTERGTTQKLAPQRRWLAGTENPQRHRGPIVALAYSRDRQMLLSAGGKTISWWDLKQGKRIRFLRGPQTITTAILGPDDTNAYFGTQGGHLYRWTLRTREAIPLPKYSCGAIAVDLRRAGLPTEKRCPYGEYIENQAGAELCVYPLTHLARHGTIIARACRTGHVTIFSLGAHRTANFPTRYPTRYPTPGALRALRFSGSRRLLMTREEGKSYYYDLKEGKTIKRLEHGKQPNASAATPTLLAVAVGKRMHLWVSGETASITTISAPTTYPLPSPALWLGVMQKPERIIAVLRNGSILSYLVHRISSR